MCRACSKRLRTRVHQALKPEPFGWIANTMRPGRLDQGAVAGLHGPCVALYPGANASRA